MTYLARAACVGWMSVGLALAGCGALPSAGPAVSSVESSHDVELVRATPALARERAASEQARSSAAVDRSVDALSQAPADKPFEFSPGDALHLTMWTISPWPGTDSPMGATNAPAPIELGDYTVSEAGTIDLPYVGATAVEGLSLDSAQTAIALRYASLGIMQSPSAKITLTSSPRRTVIVTGAIGAPKIVPWTPAGLSLASALTQAMGSGVDLAGSMSERGADRNATQVTVVRNGTSVTLPLEQALVREIWLHEGDRIVVKRAPMVRVTVVGGGAQKNGRFDFAHVPSLSEVLASASGLNGNVADNHAVFVLEKDGHGKRPVVYDFSWNELQGVVASHDFPLKDGDMVYVAEAPIVPFERAVSILFQLAVPVQAAK